MTANPHDPPPPPGLPTPQQAFEFMQRMWNPLGVPLPGFPLPGTPAAAPASAAGAMPPAYSRSASPPI